MFKNKRGLSVRRPSSESGSVGGFKKPESTKSAPRNVVEVIRRKCARVDDRSHE